MMILIGSSPYSSDESLAHAIGNVGRRMTSRTLGLILLGGVVAVLAIGVLWHGHRMMTVPLIMPITFAIWGLAEHGERVLEADGPGAKLERSLLRAIRVAMVAIGASVAVASLFAATFAVAGQGPFQLR